MRRLVQTTTVAVGLAVLTSAGIATTASAHHSFAMDARSVTYVFTAVVDRVDADPSHLQIFFVPLDEKREALTRDAKGQRVTWTVEMSGAGASAREGITVTSFPQGTVFSVALMPLRNGRHGGARSGAIFRCPEGRVPKPGLHCDSVDGSVLHGQGELVEATGGWSP
jgi:hypothetical protein